MGNAGADRALRVVDPVEGVESPQKGKGAQVSDIRGEVQEGFWQVEMGEYLATVQSALERAMTPKEEEERWAIVKDMPQTD